MCIFVGKKSYYVMTDFVSIYFVAFFFNVFFFVYVCVGHIGWGVKYSWNGWDIVKKDGVLSTVLKDEL